MSQLARGEHLAFLIHDAQKRLRHEFTRRVAALELTPATARGLAFLSARAGSSLRALADALEVQPMSMVRVIDDLEARGLLRREIDPRDRRAHCLYLTPAGERVVDSIWIILDEIISEACGELRTAETNALRNGLKSFIAGIQRIQQSESK
ncbi:MAG: MarR family winged helix-turn-helix transcriptional regulator [Steroidobacteraceae bacterium]|jgi:DNA-binding MarR family transcriptional regulator|nr:MarR family transcriptional regulator [Gammaproteobacteria bacterium]